MQATKNAFTARLFALTLLAATASAQTLTVSGGAILQGGDTVLLTYTDPAKAGQTVVVLVSGGFPTPTVSEVAIVLDANGQGTGKWVVNAGWRSANFDAPDVSGFTVPIQ